MSFVMSRISLVIISTICIVPQLYSMQKKGSMEALCKRINFLHKKELKTANNNTLIIADSALAARSCSKFLGINCNISTNTIVGVDTLQEWDGKNLHYQAYKTLVYCGIMPTSAQAATMQRCVQEDGFLLGAIVSKEVSPKTKRKKGPKQNNAKQNERIKTNAEQVVKQAGFDLEEAELVYSDDNAILGVFISATRNDDKR